MFSTSLFCSGVDLFKLWTADAAGVVDGSGGRGGRSSVGAGRNLKGKESDPTESNP